MGDWEECKLESSWYEQGTPHQGNRLISIICIPSFLFGVLMGVSAGAAIISADSAWID